MIALLKSPELMKMMCFMGGTTEQIRPNNRVGTFVLPENVVGKQASGSGHQRLAQAQKRKNSPTRMGKAEFEPREGQKDSRSNAKERRRNWQWVEEPNARDAKLRAEGKPSARAKGEPEDYRFKASQVSVKMPRSPCKIRS
jgi:hypothetical protein